MRKVSPLKLASTFVALIFGIHAAPAFATGRTMFSTINLNRSDSGAVDSAMGGSTVVSVTLKNISNQTQTVTVKFADITVHAESTFATEAQGLADLPGWTEMQPAKVVRFTDPTTYPVQTVTLTLGSSGSSTAGTAGLDIFCEYTDPIACYFGDQTNYIVNNDIKGITFQSTFSVEVDVAEDRGAILADVTTQMRLFTTPSAVNVPNSTRSLNGGRPF